MSSLQDPAEEIGWLDPRWLDPRPMMYNAAEQAEEFAMNVWHKFQSWKVVGFSTLPQWLQVGRALYVHNYFEKYAFETEF
jgi:hypothetical protein